jgi:DNA polymerase III alpha subunit
MNYINFHSHGFHSNIITPDVVISNVDRTNRTLELGMSVLGGIEHGYCGRFIEIIELAKKNNLKPLLGVETYFVKNRFEKDATNSHLILLAKNENGRKAINRILSEANVTGFYYKARTDLELVLSLPATDVWVTSACLGGVWKYEDYEDLIIQFKNHFGNNFFLEVQNHNVDKQRELNKEILRLSDKYEIQIIAGMDTHMIHESQKTERDNYLLSRGISYPDEEGWFMDFPSYEIALNRFKEQGVLSKEQAETALQNTMIFEEVEPYTSIIFNDKLIKMPTLYPDKTQEEKDKIFIELVWERWNEQKKDVPSEKWSLYKKEIQKEIDVVIKSKMSDYFLLDEKIVARGKEMGGSITLTGRGSAPSFYIMKLLGITTLDRISASVKLFPERFITAERILETGSLPDVDLNLGTPEIFAEAQKEIIGESHSYPMIAFGKVKTSGAWKLYARAVGVDFETSNYISDVLKGFEHDVRRYIDENPDDVDFDNAPQVEDYLGSEHLHIFRESRKYLNIVNTISPHPCAYLLYGQGDIKEEFGLLRLKSGTSEHICVNCDGEFAEKYKMFKNDLLKVSVVDLIHRVFDRIGIEPFSLSRLLEVVDDATWDIYKNGLGMGINQVEKSGTIERVAKYAPKSISDLSAFVAAIRPGFKSNYAQFEARLPFEYGVKSLDDVIQTEEFPYSYMLYQENAMNVMAWTGISIKETYDVVKNIAKKRYEKVLSYKTKFINGMIKRLMEAEKLNKKKSSEIANMTWQIIEDSSRYSFNASHSYSVAGDSLYGAWLKAHYPIEFYEVFLQMMEEDGNKDRLSLAKKEAETFFHIKFPKLKFGQDNRKIIGNKETNEITQSIKSMKGFGLKISEDMFELHKLFEGKTFVDLLVCAEENKLLSSKFEQLIKIGYFEDFGSDKKLLNIFHEFKAGKFRYSQTLKDKTKEVRLKELKEIELFMEDQEFSIQEKVAHELEVTQNIISTFDVDRMYAAIIGVNTDYTPKIMIHSLREGIEKVLKVGKRIFNEYPLKVGDVILAKSSKKKHSGRYDAEGNWIENPDKFETWLESYYIMKPQDQFLPS